MTKKIKNKKAELLNFIIKHKQFSIVLVIGIMFIVLPLFFNSVKADEGVIDLSLKNPSLENSKENPYIIDSIDDFIVLQEYSKTHDCYGMYFSVGDTLKNNKLSYTEGEEDEEGSEAGEVIYNMNLVGTIFLEDGSRTTFYGIGQNYKYPFRGNIDFKGISVRVDTPLFCFVGSGADISVLHLFGDIIPEKMNSIVTENATLGFLAGMAVLDGSSPLNISEVSISHNSSIIGTTKSVGGLIGLVMANPNSNASTYEEIKAASLEARTPKRDIDYRTTHFTINLDRITIPDEIELYSTGYRGSRANGINVEKGTLPSNFQGYTGGIVGEIMSRDLNYYVDVNFTGMTKVCGSVVNVEMGSGGVIGHITNKVCVKFDGVVDVSGLTEVRAYSATAYRGYMIGSVGRQGLAYMTENATVMTPTLVDLKSTNETDIDYSDINNTTAATVYRDTSSEFFVKEVKIEGEGTKTNPYLLKTVDDVERLSIILSTQGLYGIWYEPFELVNANGSTRMVDSWSGWFDVPDNRLDANGAISYSGIVNHLRGAYYVITDDINLSEKNIVRLLRCRDNAFCGSIEGQIMANGEYPTLTLDAREHQAKVALIPFATGKLDDENNDGVKETIPCEFKNFNINGTVEGRAAVGGLIYSLSQNNNSYGNYVFENINMELDLAQKLSNGDLMSGFICDANYYSVTASLNEGIKLIYNDISYNGNLVTASSGSSNGGVLAGNIYVPANDMNNSEDINKFEILVDNYDFMGTIKCSTNYTYRVSAFINTITNSNKNGYKTYNVAGKSVNFGKYAWITANNINIHDSEFINSDSTNITEFGGILGYSWGWTDAKFTNVLLENVEYNNICGYGGMLLTYNSAILDIDGLTYNNVNMIRNRAGNNAGYWNSTMLYSNTGIVKLNNHNVIDSSITSYTSRTQFAENAVTNQGFDYTRHVETHGIFSYEGNAANGNPYSTLNPYVSPYTYRDLNGNANEQYKNRSYLGTRVYYNVYSNMQGDYISGTGTKADPFILNSESDLVVFSNVNTKQSFSTYLEYFKDIENILTDEEKTTMSFTEKSSKYYERIFTGVYVLAKEADLTEYSYYPANNFTGKFYGFDAYKYSGSNSLDDATLKSYCASAIVVLDTDNANGGLTLEIVNNNKPEIHFAADVIGGVTDTASAVAEGVYRPWSSYGIHTDLHSSLFGPITGSGTYVGTYKRGKDVTISNLKFTGVSGSRSNNNTSIGGGAFLISGCCGNTPAVYYAVMDVEHIDFQDAFILTRWLTTSGSSAGSGLLIDTICESDVNITDIKILKDEHGCANVRADALIGYQYGNSSKVIFRNIDLNAVIDQGDLRETTTVVKDEDGNDIQVNTVIIENSSEKEAAWRSTSDPDYATYGYGFKYGYYYFYLQAGAAIYYYDVGEDIVTPGRLDANDEHTIQNKVLLRSVQKYAYKTINVDVNPQNGNITQGAGTEDDPYIIENLGQFLALTNFIKYNGEIVDYEDWWVGDIDGTGYDPLDTDTWADNANLIYKNRYISSTQDGRLNAVRHLASAHYKIVADIDFTDPNSPFSEMASNFNGLGTSSYPFSGSIIGEKKPDGSYPTIYFGQNTANYQNYFGLILYGKGIKVKNLNFENGYIFEERLNGNDFEYNITQEKNRIYVTNSSDTRVGMVAAYINGGDNIIENVNVNVSIQKQNDTANNGRTFCVGGYVGWLTRGTLKVSGINEDTFENFRIGAGNSMTDLNYTNTNYRNRYVSAIVGRVDCATIIYDDAGISEDIATINTKRVTSVDGDGNTICEVPLIGYYNKNGIACCDSANFYNYNYFDTIDKIKVIYDTRENKTGTLIAQLENEKQVLLYSIFLGNGSLSSNSGAGPFDSIASCHKDAEEWADWIAYENANSNSEIKITDDYNFPLAFRYFDFTELDDSYKSTIFNNCSLLNMMNTSYQNNANYRTTWMLTGADVYDMGLMKELFKGIGPKLNTDYSFNDGGDQIQYMCMNANFDGNGRTIKLDLSNNFYVGLFTYLNTQNNGNSNAHFNIGNFTLEGTVTQPTETSSPVAGVAAYQRHGYFRFSDIVLQNLSVTNNATGTTYTAGILASIQDYSHLEFNNITIGDPDSNDSANVLISVPKGNGSAAAAMIGTARKLTADNINISNTTVYTATGSVGGLAANLNNYRGKITIDNVNVHDCTFETGNSAASVGAVVGYMNSLSTNSNFMALHNINVCDNNLIAPDGAVKVGRVVGAHTVNGVHGCKREILKLSVKNSDDFTGPTTDKIWNCLIDSTNEDCKYIFHNDFFELVKAEELYDIDRDAVDGDGNPLVRYDNDSIVDDLFTYDFNNDGIGDSVDLITGTDRMDNTILKWSSDYGTIENVINSVLNTLTNGTGLINNGINDNITISVESLQVNNGVVSPRTDGETISIMKRDGQFVIVNNNKYDKFEKDDALTGEHIPGTFSLIHIKYTIGKNTFSEEITIPIFVGNMVNVDIYSKLLIGEEYDIDIMRAIQRTSFDAQKTTKNSSYTVYTEIMYSSNRVDFDEDLYLNKGFRLYEASDPVISVGTKLTLVDITFDADPKIYYYEVTSADNTFIPLTWFKDENGVPYVERNLNMIDRNFNGLPETRVYTTMYVNQRTFKKYNRGIEKYLLFVDCSNVAQVGSENDFSPMIMNDVDDLENKEVFYIKQRTYNTLSTYVGRTMEFVDGSVSAIGEINKDKQLDVQVSFSDSASDYYWSDVKPYDYINQGKYLEIVSYLKNEYDEKIVLPSGTMIKYSAGSTGYDGIKNTSAIFYYKDVAVNEEYELMSRTQNSVTTIDFSLDFTYAKMENLPSGNYTVCFDLVRNGNPEYPMGDDILDTIESTVIEVTTNAEYGFRLDTKGKDTLAFNIADVPEGTPSVVDFDVLINSTLPLSLAENKEVEIRFNLYKKDKDTGIYVPYADANNVNLVDIKLELSNETETVSKILNTGELSYSMRGIADRDSEPQVLNAVMTIPYTADISNYKLQAEMYVNGDKWANDFLIVNISDIEH